MSADERPYHHHDVSAPKGVGGSTLHLTWCMRLWRSSCLAAEMSILPSLPIRSWQNASVKADSGKYCNQSVMEKRKQREKMNGAPTQEVDTPRSSLNRFEHWPRESPAYVEAI